MTSVTVLALIDQMAAKLEAAGLTLSDGFGHGTTNAFDGRPGWCCGNWACRSITSIQ